MLVEIRLFAILRERAGSPRIDLELADDATVADALAALAAEGPLAGVLERLPVRMAVNRDYARAETRLRAGDELALIPPVSGGAATAGVEVRITEEELSVERLTRAVTRDAAGAVVVFCGVTREVASLEYEAYREMAEEQLAAIARSCLERHRLAAIAIEHRVGTVALGEPSVIVAVSAPHRTAAFAGARDAIDEVKARAAIWKRELTGGGSAPWAQGTLPE
jgi:MoaE-MoaD fusion protein